MFNIDTKDIKRLTDNLKNCNKSAFPLTVRGTLNGFAYETSNIAKTKILPKVFTLRNKFIQGSVGYKKCENTFNIASNKKQEARLSLKVILRSSLRLMLEAVVIAKRLKGKIILEI